jgi:hypothetical protein
MTVAAEPGVAHARHSAKTAAESGMTEVRDKANSKKTIHN